MVPSSPRLTALLGPLALVLAAAACGGDPSRTDAVDRIVGAACNTYRRCEAIGPGLMYPDRAACEANERTFWDETLPPETCDDKIIPNRLDTCTATISGFECEMLLDFHDVVGVCGPRAICSSSSGS